MFANDQELNIDAELAKIPPEYQEIFRQAIEQEMADAEQNHTDTERLAYLRRRRDEIQQGGFIRPDGRPGLMTLSPEAIYGKAFPEIVRDSVDESDRPAERRRTMIKVGLFAGVALLFLLMAVRGRVQRATAPAAADDTPAEEVIEAESSAAGMAAPTPALPEISGVEDSLQTIGGLGGALTIGRPSAIELTYRATEETIALAIDPSRPTARGELRYNEAAMLSDNPVAVWLFGTVLNYTIGIPDSMVRNLAEGDRVTLSTDTGAALHFVVAETWSGATYEAGRLLSQNRLGLTLFALPAAAEDDVAFAYAHYDVTGEEGQQQVVYAVGEIVFLPDSGSLQLSLVEFSHTEQGELRIVIIGETTNLAPPNNPLISLTTSQGQTTAVPLAPNGAGEWTVEFTLPLAVAGRALFAEFRTLSGGNLAMISLGEVPRLSEQLTVTMAGAWWEESLNQAVVDLTITNSGPAPVYLGADFIQILNEGGDAYAPNGQVTPRLPGQAASLPLLINPGETLGMTVTFHPFAASMRLQIGADLWEVSGFPVE